jgi:hypothetical protein
LALEKLVEDLSKEASEIQDPSVSIGGAQASKSAASLRVDISIIYHE